MGNSNALELAADLRRMKAAEVIRDPRVRSQFVSVYNSVWGDGGENAYERESLYFNQQLREKAALRECTGISIFYSFIDLAVRGLSLAPGPQALCYLIPRGVKLGTDPDTHRDVWGRQCSLTVSAYGELVLRANAGQIRHADNPVIVYEGDTFEYGERDGRKTVNYMSAFPRKSGRIVACFIKITRADGSFDYSVMTEPDWMRLKDYSDRQNTYYDKDTRREVTRPNELYGAGGGQIDAGFLMAKCIKHAFRSYPRLKIGRGTALESETADVPEGFDPYGGVAEQAGAPARDDSPTRDEASALTADSQQGITVDPAAQPGNDDVF